MSRVRWIKNYRDIQIVVLVAIVCATGALVVQRQLEQTDLYAVRSSIGKPFGLCHEGYQADCVVDGDTISYSGHLIRMVDYDVPEIGEPTCSSALALRHNRHAYRPNPRTLTDTPLIVARCLKVPSGGPVQAFNPLSAEKSDDD